MLKHLAGLLSVLATICAISLHGASARDTAATPQVVFVPGILGSKIQVAGRPVWGDGKFDEPALALTDGQEVTTSELDALDVDLLLTKFHRTVYGALFEALQQDLSASNNVTLFSYDWRTSNKRSAEKLAIELCRLSADGSPLVLVAHSMGGLVVKHWLRNSYGKPCPNGTVPVVRSLIFAATPHLGSPQAVLSLIDEISLDRTFNWMVGGGLNRFGYTFDSIYELLPAAHAYRERQSANTMCISSRPQQRQGGATAFFKNPTSGKLSLLDIFQADIYEKLGIYERFKDLGNRPDRHEYLQNKLTAARNNICDLLEVAIPADLAKRTYYLGGYTEGAGYRQPNTTAVLTISTNRDSLTRTDITIDDTYHLQIDKGIGDGTVPVFAALDGYDEFLEVDVELRLTNANHESILDGTMFRELVAWQRRADDSPVVAVGALSFPELVGSIQSVRAAWIGAGSAKLVAEIAASNSWNSVDATTRYAVAKQLGDPVLFEAVAEEASLPLKLQAWALQNSAFYYAQSNQRADAQRAIDKAINLLNLSGDDAVKSELLPKLYTTSGWVNMTAGMLDEAKIAYELALESNSELAQGGLKTLDNLQVAIPPIDFDFSSALDFNS